MLRELLKIHIISILDYFISAGDSLDNLFIGYVREGDVIRLSGRLKEYNDFGVVDRSTFIIEDRRYVFAKLLGVLGIVHCKWKLSKSFLYANNFIVRYFNIMSRTVVRNILSLHVLKTSSHV